MTMIDKVAAAIATKQTLNEMAKAAIEAMREPTNEMLYKCSWNDSAYDSWKAMIDAALKED